MLNHQPSPDNNRVFSPRQVERSILLGADHVPQSVNIVFMPPAARARIQAFTLDFASATVQGKAAAEAFYEENDRFFSDDATQFLEQSGLSPATDNLDEELAFITKRDGCVAEYKEHFAELSVKMFHKQLCQKYRALFLQDGSRRLADEMEVHARRLEIAMRHQLSRFRSYPLQDYIDRHFG